MLVVLKKLFFLITIFLIAKPTIVFASPNYALYFNGSGSNVATGTTNVMNKLPLTVEAWVRPELRQDQPPPVRFGIGSPNNVISNDKPGSAGLWG